VKKIFCWSSLLPDTVLVAQNYDFQRVPLASQMNSNWTFGDALGLLQCKDYDDIVDFTQFKERKRGLAKSALTSRYAFMVSGPPAAPFPPLQGLTTAARSCPTNRIVCSSKCGFELNFSISDEEENAAQAKKVR